MQQIDIGDSTVTLKSVTQNKTFHCDGCGNFYPCELKKSLSIKPDLSGFTACEVLLNIRNLSTVGVSISASNWEMVDTDAYAYGAKPLCSTLRPATTVKPGSWVVSPGTQVDFILVFPEIETGKEIARILYAGSNKIQVIEINPLTQEAAKLFEAREEAKPNIAVNEHTFTLIHASFNEIEQRINSRLHNILGGKEMDRLENVIREKAFVIEQQLQDIGEANRSLFQEKYENIMTNFKIQSDKLKEKEVRRRSFDKKVEQLMELSPRDFEIYVADLFMALGYEKVELTPATNDKGVDVLIEHQGQRIAIQCKKYKGLIGSPMIQTFIGAMRHAESQKGFFVTTSVFSIEAEKMAAQHPIELIDGTRLAELIQKALEI